MQFHNSSVILLCKSNSREEWITILNIPKKALVLALLAAVCLMAFSSCSTDDGLILSNVTAGGVDIGGRTPEEAKILIQRQTDLTFPYEDMVIELPDEVLRLSPGDTGVTLDVDAMVADAFNYGRSGTKEENKAIREAAETTELVLELGDYLTLDTDYIQSRLDAYLTAHSSEFAESSVTVEGETPALDGENFNAETPCQTITVYTGNPGMVLDMTGVYEMILEAYGRNEFLVKAEIPREETLPTPVDLTELHQQTLVAPVDASINKDGKINPETYGYEFDLAAATTLIGEAPYGETITITYQYVEPEWTAAKLESATNTGSGSDSGSGSSSQGKLFQDVLASYKTSHTSDSNRNTNLKLACKAINGMVLMPGEQFSYNAALGERTAAKGYKAAGAYVNGQTVATIGGGICQVSSTLYYCTLIADLKIDTRLPHGYVSSYMPMGMDATVSWGGPHFRFTNNTGYPMKIEAWVSGGYVHVKLLGTNTKDYKVKMEYEVLGKTEYKTEYKVMTSKEAKEAGYYDGQVIQTPYTGYKVKTYKLKYDLNGKLISRTYEATSNYKSRDKIIVKIDNAQKPTEAPTVKPTEKPTQAPTEKPTEKPTQAPTEKPTAPPTEAPTQAPTTPPTEAPTQAPTTPPTETPPQAPTTPPTEAPAPEDTDNDIGLANLTDASESDEAVIPTETSTEDEG